MLPVAGICERLKGIQGNIGYPVQCTAVVQPGPGRRIRLTGQYEYFRVLTEDLKSRQCLDGRIALVVMILGGTWFLSFTSRAHDVANVQCFKLMASSDHEKHIHQLGSDRERRAV